MINNNELWKPIPEYEYYEVSSNGRIRRVRTQGGKACCKELKLRTNKYGYVDVSLCKNNKHKTLRIHYLVLNTFIKKSSDIMQPNHIDGVKTNNRLDNLEWLTPSDNRKHTYSLGLQSQRGEHNANSILTEEYVYAIKELLYSGDLSQVQIGCLLGVNHNTIHEIHCGHSWTFVLYP